MVFSLRVTKRKKADQISIQGAFNLWDILTAKYTQVDLIQVLHRFVHDLDLRIILESYLKDLQRDIRFIEKQMNKYGIPAPDGPRKGVNAANTKESVSDESIGQALLILTQENMEMLLKAIRTSATNDPIRKAIMKVLAQRADYVDKIIKYLKLKGWLNSPPAYPHIPPENSEVIDMGEAFHLWDHLTFRYDSIEQTQLFYKFAHDGDFKTILKIGLMDGLSWQTDLLEKECFYFGLPLPKTPSVSTSRVENLQLNADDGMYRQLLLGIQGSLIIHMQAFKQATTNDRIRGIFRRLLFDELKKLNLLLKYGKTKGWLFPAPQL